MPALQRAPEPIDLVGRFKKGMVAENGRMLPFNDVFHLPNRFARAITNALDMLRNEQQSMGVNMSVVDEPSRFLGATTGVALVDEAALVVHEMVKVPASARQG